MLLYYVRHGDPIYDPDELTPLGRRQAEAVGKRIARHGVDQIFASTSTRAIQTAQPAAEMLKLDITQMDFCHENHAWNQLSIELPDGGRTWAFRDPATRRLFASEEIRALGDRWYEHPAIRAYHFDAGIERIRTNTDAWLASLGYEHDAQAHLYRIVAPNNKRVALFAHEGFGAAFLSCVLDIPYPMFSTQFSMGHTGMTVIEFQHIGEEYAQANVLTMANDGHLYAEGLHTKYQNRMRI